MYLLIYAPIDKSDMSLLDEWKIYSQFSSIKDAYEALAQEIQADIDNNGQYYAYKIKII